MGWGVDGIKGVPLGGFIEQVAAMKRKQSDGFVWSYEGGMELDEKGEGKVLLSFGQIIKDFEFEVIVASRTPLMHLSGSPAMMMPRSRSVSGSI